MTGDMSARPRTWIVPALVALLLALVPLLAWLQLRWIDALSRSEQARLGNFVVTGAERLARDLDGHLAALRSSHRVSLEDGGASLAGQLAERHRAWRAETRWPGLVARVLWVDGARPDAPWALDVDTASLRAEEWGAEDAHWPRALGRLLGAADDAPSGSPRSIDLPAEPPTLVLPTLHRDAHGAARLGCVLLVLDERVLADELLAALVERHLAQPFGAPVDVLVRRGDGVVFASRAELVADGLPAPDAQVHVPSGESVELALEPGDGSARRLSLDAAHDVEHEIEQLVTTDGPVARDVAPVERRLHAPPWEIRVRHAEGSIAAAVASVRARNLALGFGVLGVLAAAAVLLLLAARRARGLARRQVEFLAGITHELRTPLTVLRSAADNLASGVVREPERAAEYGRLMVAESRRLSELVEQALTLAGTDGTALAAAPRPLDLAELLPDVVARCRASWPDGPAPRLELPESLPEVRADPRALEQVLVNLLDNARKYGGADPEIGLRVDAAPGARRVAVAVWDRGPGIPADERARLGEPFFRGARAREAGLPGSGLGLSIVRRTLAALGSRLEVHSAPGDGSTFRFELEVVAP